MLRSIATAIAALFVAATFATLVVPPAEAISCAALKNPFPPSPVGGQVGVIYTFATGTTFTVVAVGWSTTCRTLGIALGTAGGVVDAECNFLVGHPCIGPIA